MANKLNLCVAATLAFCALSSTATATMELYLTDPTGNPSQVEILPGERFQIQVGYATTEPTCGLSYYLSISDAGSGNFTITDRILPADGRFLDLISSNTQALASAAALLDPRNDLDLGAVNANPLVPEPPGLYVAATITITAASDVAPGTYVLGTWYAIGTDPDFNSIPMAVHDYTIVVTNDSDGGGTGGDPTDTDGGTGGSTDGNTPDSGTDSQTTDGTRTGIDGSSGSTQTGEGDTGIIPVATASRCGAGVSGITTLAASLAIWMVRVPSRRR